MVSADSPRGLRISIDRGGTFTDCVAAVPGGEDVLVKLLSVDPANYQDAPVEAIRRVLEKVMKKSYPKGQKISLDGVGMWFFIEITEIAADSDRIDKDGYNCSNECSA